MDPEKESFTEDEVRDLIKVYIGRNDDELEELQSLHRKGRPRPKASREDAIMLIKEKESLEFNSGFLLPDLGDKENVQKLRCV
jgi:translation machinery-associated protein 16